MPAPIPGEEVPILLAGERRCPPEDFGSLSGFEAFLKAMADPDDPEHEAMTTWYGGPFDPADIDQDRINRRLAAIAKRRQRGRNAGRASAAVVSARSLHRLPLRQLIGIILGTLRLRRPGRCRVQGIRYRGILGNLCSNLLIYHNFLRAARVALRIGRRGNRAIRS